MKFTARHISWIFTILTARRNTLVIVLIIPAEVGFIVQL